MVFTEIYIFHNYSKARMMWNKRMSKSRDDNDRHRHKNSAAAAHYTAANNISDGRWGDLI